MLYNFFIMKYLLFIIPTFIFIFCFLVKKYKNPYTLTLIFGKKGSGKSTLMVKYMIQYLKKGWNVYTDMPDVNINGVRIIDAHNLEKFTPKKHSAIFLDEIGLTFDNRKFKSFADGINQWYKFQRKYKCVVFCNSQSFDVDLKIRILVDKMILMESIGGFLALARPIKRTITLTDPTSESESRVADRLEFEKFWNWKLYFLPRYFKYFDSYSAPVREYIPFKTVTDGVSVLKEKNPRQAMNKEDHLSKGKKNKKNSPKDYSTIVY